MTDTTQIELDYLRLTALASDMEQFLTECGECLCVNDYQTLFDMSSQLRGMSALLVQEDVHPFINCVVKSSLDEFVRINLTLSKDQ